MLPILDTAGEDKMLEFALLKDQIRVNYLSTAIVLDEKVSKGDHFEGQRTRWVAARYYFMKKEFPEAAKRLFHADFDYFNKWLQFLLPQKVLLMAFALLFSGISLILGYHSGLVAMLLAILVFTYVFSIPGVFYKWSLLRSIVQLPQVVLRMIRVLYKAGKADPTSFNVTTKEV